MLIRLRHALLVSLLCLGGSLAPALAADQPKPGKPVPPEVRGARVGNVYHGHIEIWSNPSTKQAEGEFRNGKPDGQWTFWDDEGIKIVEISYSNGMFSGAVTMWNPAVSGPRSKGKLKFRGAFIDGEWQGSALSYYADGKVRSERIYQKGVIADAQVFSPVGKPFSPADSSKVAEEDERIDNAFVDALDAYICKWVK